MCLAIPSKIIQIDEQQRELDTFSIGLTNLPPQTIIQIPIVVQPGQVVTLRDVTQERLLEKMRDDPVRAGPRPR